MKSGTSAMSRTMIRFVTLTGALLLLAAGAQAAGAQRTFATPEEAAAALVAAAKAGDTKAQLSILGSEAKPLLQSGDKVADKAAAARFVSLYETVNKLEKSGDAKAVLTIGKDAWPFPIPIVKEAAGWRFDTAAGKEEILNRRIGRNELAAMQSALAYCDAQREYYARNPQHDKLLQYAQKFVSTQGKRDGLYFPTKDGEPRSPLGPLFEKAKAAGYEKGGGYHGYRYKILKAQGPDAKGGAYDYVVKGKMIGGYALVAWPVNYGNTGVMTFIVNHDGVIYQKDLGTGTASAAQQMTRFNPDKTWKPIEQ
jgi:hypothetical protein